MKQTVIISGFPGVGKSHYFNRCKHIENMCLDSDSSKFSWIKDEVGINTKERNPEFPKNYIEHIKSNIGKVDVIFVSSHKVVREALEKEGLNYYLVYPKREDKTEYIRRYRKRGNDENFIQFISANWDEFITDMENETFPFKRELPTRKFLSPIEVNNIREIDSCEKDDNTNEEHL